MAFYCRKAVSIVVCIIALSTIQGKIFAQHKQGYTLSELTDSAARHLPSILQKQALISAARAGVTDAQHASLPALKVYDQLTLSSANGATGSYLPGMVIPTASAIRSSNIYQPASGNIAMLYGEYELVNFGLRKARIADAVANEQLKESDLSRDLYLLKLQISKLYFTLLRNLLQLGADQQNVHRYQSAYTIIQAITKSGIKAGVDSSLALAELSKAEISYTKKTGDIQQLQQQLAFLTGITDSIAIDTTEQQYAAPSYFSRADNNDSAVNPLLEYYRKQRATYVSATNLIKKSYLPKIVLAGGVSGRGTSIDYNNDDNYKALSTGWGYQRFNYMTGLSFVYNLFDGVHRKDKLAVSNYNMQASDYAMQQQQQALHTAQIQAETALRIATESLQKLPVQLQAASDAYGQKLAQYKAGIINLVDLTNASFVLYSAQTDYVEALNDWMQAHLDKAAATGNLDLFIESLKN